MHPLRRHSFETHDPSSRCCHQYYCISVLRNRDPILGKVTETQPGKSHEEQTRVIWGHAWAGIVRSLSIFRWKPYFPWSAVETEAMQRVRDGQDRLPELVSTFSTVTDRWWSKAFASGLSGSASSAACRSVAIEIEMLKDMAGCTPTLLGTQMGTVGKSNPRS